MLQQERAVRFDALAAEVYEPLQRYLRRRSAPDDVDDLLNDTLLTIWRRIDDIPSDKTLPWCYGVARRSLANQRRSRTRRLRLVERVASATLPTTSSSPGDPDADGALQKAIDRLSELDREVVRLWAWEQLEPRDIAEVLDTTPNAISVRLTRIRNRLRSDLERKDRLVAGHEAPEPHSELEP